MDKLDTYQQIRLKCLEAIINHKSSEHPILQLQQIYHWVITGESFSVFSSYPYLKHLKYNPEMIEFLLTDIKINNHLHPENDLQK